MIFAVKERKRVNIGHFHQNGGKTLSRKYKLRRFPFLLCFFGGITAVLTVSGFAGDEADKVSNKRPGSNSEIMALPYLEGYHPAPPKTGVTYYDNNAAYRGLNFFFLNYRAFLMDMEGNTLHSWCLEFKDVSPELEGTDHWRDAYLFPDGDLLAVFEEQGVLIKIDRHSRLLWFNKCGCHHDLCLDKNGNIYVITRREITEHDSLDLSEPIQEDYITILNPRGKIIKSVSLLDCFLNSDYASALAFMGDRGDVFHTNSIQLMDGRTGGKAPPFKDGSVLISVRNLHTIAVVDLNEEKVTWALSGMWKYQHQPLLLENGNVLLFDNLGNKERSRVIEFNPLTQEIVWAYRGDANNNFFTESGGANHRMPNGNTLIVESNKGRAFEVTPGNKIVWEYFDNFRSGPDNKFIQTLYDMIRIDPDHLTFLP
jgi:arylsulfotransferase ASST